MSHSDVDLRLRHMLEHAREALELVKGKARKDFDADRVLRLALVRLVEVVGEAANRIPHTDRSRFPSVPWTGIIGLRNRLVHGYDEVDFDILWEILQKDLPELVKKLEVGKEG
jgi:uncharacterized protein with HEPN domain